MFGTSVTMSNLFGKRQKYIYQTALTPARTDHVTSNDLETWCARTKYDSFTELATSQDRNEANRGCDFLPLPDLKRVVMSRCGCDAQASIVSLVWSVSEKWTSRRFGIHRRQYLCSLWIMIPKHSDIHSRSIFFFFLAD
jgi:hypothetical protein